MIKKIEDVQKELEKAWNKGNVRISVHANLRLIERNINLNEVEKIIVYGAP